MENNKSISIYLTFFQYWLMASLINKPLRQFISLFNLTLESVRNRISFWWDSSWRVSLLSRERFFIFILFLLRGLGGGTGGDPESPSWTFLSSQILWLCNKYIIFPNSLFPELTIFSVWTALSSVGHVKAPPLVCWSSLLLVLDRVEFRLEEPLSILHSGVSGGVS